MVVVASSKKPILTRSAFDALEPGLRMELRRKLESIKPIGESPTGTDVWDRIVPIDSKLVVTEIRPLVKKYLEASFPLKFVKKGGYKTPAEAIDHLMPQLRKWCPREVATKPKHKANGATVAQTID